MKKAILISVLIVSQTLSFPVKNAWAWTDRHIWFACWTGDPNSTMRYLYYPAPLSVEIRNRGNRSWDLCVFDNKCPYTLFKGTLPPSQSISVGVCTDNQGQGSITVMNRAGYLWRYENTRVSTITLK